MSKADLTLDEIDDRVRRIEVSAQIRLLGLAAEELPDDFLGFHLAHKFELGAVGLLYYVMASSDHLLDALRNAERYGAIVNEGIRLRVRLDGSTAIELNYVGVDRGSDRHQIEFWLVAMVRICRKLTETRLAPLQVKLRHSRPGTPPEFRSFLGCDIEFNASTDELVFPAASASLPIVGADVHLNHLLVGYADQALGDRSARGATVRSRVEDLIVHLLPHGKANVSEVARRLGMSRRTLARSLSAEGATFSEVLEQERTALAKGYLDDKELPISQVAWLVGYREISSFTHAFARWTGMTPRRFRMSAGGADGPLSA
ncbi:AraC family transcriptional regulator [Bradyrhizobium lablabi]|nr:AraC family transcriptional regulator [Bradyrhizobium lablabi]